jgi:hypothetical protein
MGKVYYDSEYALLTYAKDEKLVELIWKCTYPEQEYRTVFNHAVDIATNNRVDYFLSDLRNGGAVSISNLQWLKKMVVPKAVELGVKKIGLILNEELFKKIYADSIRNSLQKSKISINFFDQRDDALNWFSFHQGK